MKRSIALLSLFSILACGRIDSTKTSQLGSLRSFEPQALSSDSLIKIQKICAALKTKEQNLNVSTSGSWSFGVSSKSCDDVKLSAESRVGVGIEDVNSIYKFRRSDNGSYFVFPDVETTGSGIFKLICQNTVNPQSPIKDSASVGIWYTTSSISNDNCSAESNEICIQIEKGVPVSDTNSSYEVISKEWLKIQVDSVSRTNYGFYTFRRLITGTGCLDNKFTETKAVLK